MNAHPNFARLDELGQRLADQAFRTLIRPVPRNPQRQPGAPGGGVCRDASQGGTGHRQPARRRAARALFGRCSVSQRGTDPGVGWRRSPMVQPIQRWVAARIASCRFCPPCSPLSTSSAKWRPWRLSRNARTDSTGWCGVSKLFKGSCFDIELAAPIERMRGFVRQFRFTKLARNALYDLQCTSAIERSAVFIVPTRYTLSGTRN